MGKYDHVRAWLNQYALRFNTTEVPASDLYAAYKDLPQNTLRAVLSQWKKMLAKKLDETAKNIVQENSQKFEEKREELQAFQPVLAPIPPLSSSPLPLRTSGLPRTSPPPASSPLPPPATEPEGFAPETAIPPPVAPPSVPYYDPNLPNSGAPPETTANAEISPQFKKVLQHIRYAEESGANVKASEIISLFDKTNQLESEKKDFAEDEAFLHRVEHLWKKIQGQITTLPPTAPIDEMVEAADDLIILDETTQVKSLEV